MSCIEPIKKTSRAIYTSISVTTASIFTLEGSVSNRSFLQMKTKQPPNNAINADSEKRRNFVAPLFTAGYGKRWASLHNPLGA